MIFARMLQSGDIKKERLLQTVTECHKVVSVLP
jgi:hypothetical protein